VYESCVGRGFLGGLCGAAGHLDDGGPFDHGGVVGGEALVVAGAASSAGDPGVGALDDPAAGQDLEAFLPFCLLDDLDGDGQLALRPVPPVAVVGPVAPDQGQEAPAPGTPEYGHAPEPDGRGITRNRGAALSCLAAADPTHGGFDLRLARPGAIDPPQFPVTIL